MSDAQAVVLEIENAIASMEDEDRKATHQAVSQILMLESKVGTRPLQMAIALIGARLAAA